MTLLRGFRAKSLSSKCKDPKQVRKHARLWILVCSLTQQEQVLAQSQGGWLSPGGGGGVGGGGGGIVFAGTGGGGGGGSGAKGVDIIQMLTKARTEYDKVLAEQTLERMKQMRHQ